ncbi:MAG: hypothetical protein AAF125_26830 [Chloroflexota bacterium]
MTESFETMLTGGHPNSLGRTVEVVDLILAEQSRLEDLYTCYHSADEVVRLRTSNAFKRVWRAEPTWVVPFIDRFLSEVAALDQPSANWTVAQLTNELDAYLTEAQRATAITVLQRYLETASDWIVLNNTMETLGSWASEDADLAAWLRPHIERLRADKRKSVAKRADKLYVKLYEG